MYCETQNTVLLQNMMQSRQVNAISNCKIKVSLNFQIAE